MQTVYCHWRTKSHATICGFDNQNVTRERRRKAEPTQINDVDLAVRTDRWLGTQKEAKGGKLNGT